MGAEIALVFALAGHDVLLSDRSEAELKAALERLARVLDRGIGRGFYKEAEKPAALSRIRTTTALENFADRDFITEAVFESEEVKAEVYRALTGTCRRPPTSAATPSTTPTRRRPPMSAEPGGPISTARINFPRPRRMNLA